MIYRYQRGRVSLSLSLAIYHICICMVCICIYAPYLQQVHNHVFHGVTRASRIYSYSSPHPCAHTGIMEDDKDVLKSPSPQSISHWKRRDSCGSAAAISLFIFWGIIIDKSISFFIQFLIYSQQNNLCLYTFFQKYSMCIKSWRGIELSAIPCFCTHATFSYGLGMRIHLHAAKREFNRYFARTRSPLFHLCICRSACLIMSVATPMFATLPPWASTCELG